MREHCDGLGTRFEVDPELIVTNPDRSVAQGAISPWAGATPSTSAASSRRSARATASPSTPWAELTDRQRTMLLTGEGVGRVNVRYQNRYGRTRSYTATYEGVVPWISRRHQDTDSEAQREQFEGYMRLVPCPACDGARLRPFSLGVTIDGRTIADLCSMSIRDAAAALAGLELSERDRMIAERVQKEVKARLGFLLDVGLDYLSLSRSAATLAGGEAQRIRLASQIGSGLVGVLYVLDEPSIGLHQRDNRRLIDTLLRLRNLGNTVLVVEHDEETIKVADHVVDIGPGAGEHGGAVVHSGTVKGLLRNRASLTGQYLAGKRSIPVPAMRRSPGEAWLTVRGAREHNLRDVDVDLPLGCFVCVTGVSGSGKSTLVNDILLRTLMQRIYRSKTPPGRHRSVEGIEHLDKVINIDQSPIGRTPRSNPATYTGVFDHIRRLFSQTQEAKVRGYLPGRFSFNVKGAGARRAPATAPSRSRCTSYPTCTCPARCARSPLQPRHPRHHVQGQEHRRGARPALRGRPHLLRQPAGHRPAHADAGRRRPRLRPARPAGAHPLGGEAQRIKLSAELSKRSTGHTIYMLDEPTTGLHFEDIRKLLTVLGRLVDQGNTVLVIEHNLDVIKTADWLIDLGPEGERRRHGGGRARRSWWPRPPRATPAGSWPSCCPPPAERSAPRPVSPGGGLGDVEHALEGDPGLLLGVGVDGDPVDHPALHQVLEHPGQVGASMRNMVEQGADQRVERHHRAVGVLVGQALHEVDLGGHRDGGAGWRRLHRPDNEVGGADLVGDGAHLVAALGVGDDDALGVLRPEGGDMLGAEALVHRAVPLPQQEGGLLASASVSPPSSKRGFHTRMSSCP